MMMKKFASRLAVSVLAFGAAFGVSLALAPAASALPTGCQFLDHPVANMEGKVSYCAGGTGYHRIELVCREYVGGPTSRVYGVWAAPGEYSMTGCISGMETGFLNSYHRNVIDPA